MKCDKNLFPYSSYLKGNIAGRKIFKQKRPLKQTDILSDENFISLVHNYVLKFGFNVNTHVITVSFSKLKQYSHSNLLNMEPFTVPCK